MALVITDKGSSELFMWSAVSVCCDGEYTQAILQGPPAQIQS